MQPILQTERLLLRPFQMSDAPDVQRLAGAIEVADTTLLIPHPYESGMAEAWITTHTHNFEKRIEATYAIMWRKTEELCGCISITVSSLHHRAALGYWIGVPFWGQGICTEAAREVLRFAFEDWNLNRVQCCHLVRNPASGRVMQKIGMAHEGQLRGYYHKNGRYEDVEQYGILRSDWLLSSTHNI